MPRCEFATSPDLQPADCPTLASPLLLGLSKAMKKPAATACAAATRLHLYPPNLPRTPTHPQPDSLQAVDKDGLTACAYAAAAGHRGVMDLLLDAGAAADKAAHDSSTPLLLAAGA